MKKRVELGEVCLIMGDMNAAINPCESVSTRAAKKILEWEGNGKVKFLNDKKEPTHVPYIKGPKHICLDVIMLTPGLKKKLKS